MSTKSSSAKSKNRMAPTKAADRRRVVMFAGAAVLVLGALVAIFLAARSGKSGAGAYAFQVGTPGPGQIAPPIQLQSTTGGTFQLSGSRGKTVLLYFQEGLTCQPCWDQLKAIEQDLPRFQAMGIDEVVTITSDPLGALKQKASDEGLTTPILSDPNLAVSATYHANSYGMMGNSRDGHTFIVVGPDGVIRWRADYGGPPNFTMYLPVDVLLGDIQQGLKASV